MTSFSRTSRSVTFTVCFLVNPAYLVACSDDNYQFDEADMLEVLSDFNEHPWSAAGYTLEFSLEQGTGTATAEASRTRALSFVNVAHACGSRSFVKDASACASTTEMPLTGTVGIVDENGTLLEEIPVDGTMWVPSNILSTAHFDLNLDGNGTAWASWRDDTEMGFELAHLQLSDVGEEGIDIEYEASN